MNLIYIAERQFLNYLKICLKGKALRYNQKVSRINNHEFLSLNSVANETDEENLNFLQSKKTATITENIDNELVICTLKRHLSDREYRVVYETIIKDKKDITVAKQFNVSRSTVCRIRNKAVQKLKKLIKENL